MISHVDQSHPGYSIVILTEKKTIINKYYTLKSTCKSLIFFDDACGSGKRKVIFVCQHQQKPGFIIKIYRHNNYAAP